MLNCGKEAGQGVAWQRIGAWSFLMLLTVAENSLELGDFLQVKNWVSEQWPVSTTIVIETACVNTFTDEARVAVMVTGRSDFGASQA
ncbi:MAG: hypothetical protein IPF55_13360 [Rhodoferax sp.]|nr:hypothetical protein [Rhodoferax sp.]